MRSLTTLCLIASAAMAPALSAQQQSGRAPKPPTGGGRAAPSNTGSPFEIKVSGAKSASVTGNDATFCVSPGPLRNSQIFALSLVAEKWAVSLSAMRPRPAVGRHALSGDIMEGIMADLIDKTTGSEPSQWSHRTVESGTLTITASGEAKLSGTFEMLAKTEAGKDLRASGKFEAKSRKC